MNRNNYFEAGYFSVEAERNAHAFNLYFKEWKEMFLELNAYACQLRGRMRPQKPNLFQHVFAIVTFSRILDAYQCILLLMEKGAGEEAMGHVRSILESLFLIEANANKSTFAKSYCFNDQTLVLRANEKALKASLQAKRLGKPQFLTDGERRNMREAIKTLRKAREERDRRKIKKPKRKPQRSFGILDNAKAAGSKMVHEYNKHYALLCFYTHTSVSGNMEKYFENDPSGRSFKFKTGPSFEQAIPTLRHAMEFLLMALFSLNKFFSLGERIVLEKYQERVEMLLKEHPENLMTHPRDLVRLS